MLKLINLKFFSIRELKNRILILTWPNIKMIFVYILIWLIYFRAIEKLGGLETERDYPYDAEDEVCHFNTSLTRVQIASAVNISHNETDMAKWLVKNGPISIAINANAMQFYMGGVSHPYKFLCSPSSLDHGVLIVGYGVHSKIMIIFLTLNS